MSVPSALPRARQEPPPARVLRYLGQRFKIGSQGTSLLAVYACSIGVYDRFAETKLSGWTIVAGAVSFLLLFLLVRIVDDLDDLESDLPGNSPEAVAARSRHRNALLLGLASVFALLLALNAAWSFALSAAIVASLAVVVPFWIKWAGWDGMAVLAPSFEGAPLVLFAYPFAVWAAAGGAGLPTWKVAAVVGVFWAAYLFVKFSRKIGESATMQPYFLGPLGLRRALLSILGLALLAQTGLVQAGRWSRPFAVFMVAQPIVVAGWMLVGWPRAWDGKTDWIGARWRLAWKGLSYPAALLCAIGLELLARSAR